MPGRGPDALVGDVDGICYGGPYETDGWDWKPSPAGWWLGTCGHRPQDLVRLEDHPRVIRWRTIPGAQPEHTWRVPVLLTPDPDGAAPAYVSALDRVMTPQGWQAPEDLRPLQEWLLHLAHRQTSAGTMEERNARFIQGAVALLAVGQWVDFDLLATAGWLSERLSLAIAFAAHDGAPDVAEDAQP